MKYLMVLILSLFSCIASANHSNGLHLQLPDTTVDVPICDIEDLQVVQTGDGTALVMLRLKSEPARRLYQLTKKNLGKPAMWIWNGRVLSMQKLASPLREDLTVNNFTSFEADDFYNKNS